MGRVVMDTSTLVGAMLRSESKPRQALLAVVKSHVLCVSQSTLTELHVVLQRSKFDRTHPCKHAWSFWMW
jgi:predicted nucleic acid-binding protein